MTIGTSYDIPGNQGRPLRTWVATTTNRIVYTPVDTLGEAIAVLNGYPLDHIACGLEFNNDGTFEEWYDEGGDDIQQHLGHKEAKV